jgi:hypothetical protein
MTDQAEHLGGETTSRTRLARDEDVEIRLDTGEVITGTVTSMRAAESRSTSSLTVRTRSWSRWAGTPADLVGFVGEASSQIKRRSGEEPAIQIQVGFGDADEERYFDAEAFSRDVTSTETGTPGARLDEVDHIEITVGPSTEASLKAHAVFSSSGIRPGASLSLEGADRTVVAGLSDELARRLERTRPRVPALPGPVQMLLGGLLGAGYAIAAFSVGTGFLPDGWAGDVLFMLLYLAGFIGLLYGYSAGVTSLLPLLQLRRPGEATSSDRWVKRAVRVAGALGLAAFPFLLERFFGG